jgi:hypothetical protein
MWQEAGGPCESALSRRRGEPHFARPGRTMPTFGGLPLLGVSVGRSRNLIRTTSLPPPGSAHRVTCYLWCPFYLGPNWLSSVTYALPVR